jgi:hypothetical protein
VAGRPGEIQIDPLSAGAPIGSPVAFVVIPVESRMLLRAIEFEDRLVAGLLISSGPDQIFDYPPPTSGYPEVYQLADGSDDIILPIDLTPEATKIALAELKALNEKVKAFDDYYLGVDNDRENPPEYDEEGCEGIRYGYSRPFVHPGVLPDCASPWPRPSSFATYPPDELGRRDISCGRPTLDFMKAHFCPEPWGGPPGYHVPERDAIDPPVYDDEGNLCAQGGGLEAGPTHIGDCYWGLVETQYGDAANPLPNETRGDQARAFIFCLFGLSPDAVVDPWLNGYVWGCGPGQTRAANNVTYSGCLYAYDIDDPHYHRFFSAGPDGFPARLEEEFETTDEERTATDDIIP